MVLEWKNMPLGLMRLPLYNIRASSSYPKNLHDTVYMHACTLLPGNQSFYRQITSHEKGGAVSDRGKGRQQSTR